MALHFDEFELDAATYTLRRQGEPVRIEPKVLELLVYLLEHRDRLVGKQELVDRVWGGQFVSDAALARSVYVARQCLGDDSATQRYIKTVHGRGYRFCDAIEVCKGPLRPTTAEASRWPDAPEAPPAPLTPASLWVEPTALPGWRLWRWPLLLVASALLLGIGVAFWRLVPPWVGEPPSQTKAGELTVRSPSAIGVVWSVSSSDPEASLAGLSLAELLTRRLQQVPDLIVRDLSTTFEESIAHHGNLSQVAHDSGSTGLVLAHVAPSTAENRYLASFDLFSREGERMLPSPLGTYEIPRLSDPSDLAQFLLVREAIAESIAKRLAPFASLGPDLLEPSDVQAYRLYLLAYQEMLTDFCSGSGAIGMLERSLELDPEFAVGWELLAVAHHNRVWACGGDPSEYEAVIAAAGRAKALAPSWPGPDLLKVDILVETGRAEHAWELLSQVVTEHQETAVVHAARSYVLCYAGFPEMAAREVEDLLALDPLYYSVAVNGESPTALLYLGEVDRYLNVLPAADSAFHRYFRGVAELRRGDQEAAARVLEPAFRANPAGVFGRLSHALLAAIGGDAEGSLRVVEQLSRQRRELGNLDPEITFKQAEVLSFAGEHEAAIAELRNAVEGGFFSPRAIRLDPLLDPLRDDPGFEEVLAAARRRHLEFAERFGLEAEL